MRLKQINFWITIVLLFFLIGAASGLLFSEVPPGDPPTGIGGAVFLMAAFLYFLFRRTGILSSSKGVFSDLHILLGAVGVGLILIHSKGTFFSLTGLFTLALTLLFFLGLNLRFISSRQVHRNLGSRAYLFFSPFKGTREMNPVIQAKKELLSRIDPGAVEGTFGLRITDWLRNPWNAGRFLWLVKEEKNRVRRVCGTAPGYLNFSQGWGRYLHIGLAAAVMIGLLFHLFRSCPYLAF
jgi:hypothetical protein